MRTDSRQKTGTRTRATAPTETRTTAPKKTAHRPKPTRCKLREEGRHDPARITPHAEGDAPVVRYGPRTNANRSVTADHQRDNDHEQQRYTDDDGCHADAFHSRTSPGNRTSASRAFHAMTPPEMMETTVMRTSRLGTARTAHAPRRRRCAAPIRPAPDMRRTRAAWGGG
jgi:hypothetical protein